MEWARTLSNDTVESNSGVNGGGIHIGDGATVTLSNDTVEFNTANVIGGVGGDGGGVYVQAGATVTFCNDTVQHNTANATSGVGGYGGGIYVDPGPPIYTYTVTAVYIDSFTVANAVNNTDLSGLNGRTANIDGTYILKNC